MGRGVLMVFQIPNLLVYTSHDPRDGFAKCGNAASLLVTLLVGSDADEFFDTIF